MVQQISPEEALSRMEDEGWVYVDVRSVPEFEAGHPEGAFNVPWKHRGPSGLVDNPDFVRVMRATFPLDAKIIVGCQAGGRSAAAARELAAVGFTSVADQLAGWGGAKDAFGRTTEPGWQACGLPMGVAPEPGRSWDELSKKA
ncbi:MAG: rhodanese-like domain-containing protein [Myxococcales bacterium]|nr:rhodanese-like domain-containing protein [Myxococcales bacterium]